MPLVPRAFSHFTATQKKNERLLAVYDWIGVLRFPGLVLVVQFRHSSVQPLSYDVIFEIRFILIQLQ